VNTIFVQEITVCMYYVTMYLSTMKSGYVDTHMVCIFVMSTAG